MRKQLGVVRLSWLCEVCKRPSKRMTVSTTRWIANKPFNIHFYCETHYQAKSRDPLFSKRWKLYDLLPNFPIGEDQ